MIVWLASYPRSGNTFLRLVLHRMYGVATYSIYDDNDPVAQQVGPELVGYRPKPDDRRLMTEGPDVYFVKTHKRRKADQFRAIYLVRDGRDAIVSRARLRTISEPGVPFGQAVREEITRPYIEGQPSSGTWGGNVLSWLDSGEVPTAVLRYEDLIAQPVAAVQRMVSALLPNLSANMEAQIPAFRDLQKINAEFFRHGLSGAYKSEMSAELQELFRMQPENAEAMRRLGYRI